MFCDQMAFLNSIIFQFLLKREQNIHLMQLSLSWVIYLLKIDCKSIFSSLLIIYFGLSTDLRFFFFFLQGQSATLKTTILLCHVES